MLKKILTFYKKIKDIIFYGIGFISNHFVLRNHYPYQLVGERKIKTETIILYRMLGKRDVFEISIKDLLDDCKFVDKFPPRQAVKFGAFAMGDILSKETAEKRKEKFEELKEKMLRTY